MKIICLIILLGFADHINAQEMGKTENTQLNEISLFLDSISDRMIEDLKIVLDEDFGLNKNYTTDDIDLLDFEINEDGYRINLYPMNSKNTQIGHKKILSEYPNGFLRDMDLDINADNYDFDNVSDMDRMDEFYDKLQKNVIDWFSRCWQKAGGPNSHHTFYVVFHDSNKSFDLKQKKWINNKNK